MKRITLLLLVLPVLATADMNAWLKKDNPNELFVRTYVADDCPLSTADSISIANGVLIRSRIKPVRSIATRETHLRIELRCIKDVTNWVFMLSVQLAKNESSAYYGLGNDEIAQEWLGENWRDFLPKEGEAPITLPPSAGPELEIDLITTRMNSAHGGIGRNDKNGISTLLKESVERAITDYLQANFDLGEDE